MLAKVPPGTADKPANYVLIKGDPGDANAKTFLPAGWDQAGLKAAVDAGTIKVLADQFTDAWDTTKAQNNMEAIIDAANASGDKIDAVLAENDSTALGVAAALKNKSYGNVPISGQDGDTANLQNVAAGIQYVDVWKDANQLGKAAGAAALQLCEGKTIAEVAVPDGRPRCRERARQPCGPGLHDAGWQHGQVPDPQGPAHHPGQPAEDPRCQVADEGGPLQERDRSGHGRSGLQVAIQP